MSRHITTWFVNRTCPPSSRLNLEMVARRAGIPRTCFRNSFVSGHGISARGNSLREKEIENCEIGVALRGKPQWDFASAGLFESYKVVWHSRPRLCPAGD